MSTLIYTGSCGDYRCGGSLRQVAIATAWVPPHRQSGGESVLRPINGDYRRARLSIALVRVVLLNSGKKRGDIGAVPIATAARQRLLPCWWLMVWVAMHSQ